MSDAPNGPTAASLTASSAQQTINLICVKLSWMGHTVGSMTTPFHHIRVDPEPAHPKGRKGLVLASAWRQMHGPNDAGMLILDGDVAIEPTDLNTMVYHIAQDRDAVWVAPVKIWPKSTHLPSWAWGHRKPAPEGTSQADVMKLWQTDVDDPTWFTFGFTYLPRRLVEAANKMGLKTWHYPNVDKNMHELASAQGFRVLVVRGDCHPKHVNF